MPRFLNLSWIVLIILYTLSLSIDLLGYMGWVLVIDPRIFYALFVFMYFGPVLAILMLVWGKVRKKETNITIGTLITISGIITMFFAFGEYYLEYTIGAYLRAMIMLVPLVLLSAATTLQFLFNKNNPKEEKITDTSL